MSPVIDVAPLLNPYTGRDTNRDTDRDGIVPSNGEGAPTTDQRIASLDVFRGLTVALMILVDGAGGAFPSINHSPWFGVTLADFVMPFFLFLVGVSVALAFKKISNKTTAMKKVMLRAMNIFLLGLLLQGGYFHGRKHLTYGVDVRTIRWLGVLQRISIGSVLASMSEIWLVNNIRVDSLVDFARKYYIQWLFAIGLCTFYMSLLYGLLVPSWEYEAPLMNLSSLTSITQTSKYLAEPRIRCNYPVTEDHSRQDSSGKPFTDIQGVKGRTKGFYLAPARGLFTARDLGTKQRRNFSNPTTHPFPKPAVQPLLAIPTPPQPLKSSSGTSIRSANKQRKRRQKRKRTGYASPSWRKNNSCSGPR
ncbi:hypothetical protein ACLB2K_051148 [Fragaria x ananassa]